MTLRCDLCYRPCEGEDGVRVTKADMCWAAAHGFDPVTNGLINSYVDAEGYFRSADAEIPITAKEGDVMVMEDGTVVVVGQNRKIDRLLTWRTNAMKGPNSESNWRVCGICLPHLLPFLPKEEKEEQSMTVYRVRMVREGHPRYISSDLTSPGDVAAFARKELLGETRECAIVIYLDTKNRPLNWSLVSIGTLDRAQVSPRDVFAPAIAQAAASIILIHNHPSGRLEASYEDRNLARTLVEGGKLLGIRVLDSIIVTDHKHFSFAEMGLMPQPEAIA